MTYNSKDLVTISHIFVETMKCLSICVSAHWDVAATVCRSSWIPTQCGVGIEDEKHYIESE